VAVDLGGVHCRWRHLGKPVEVRRVRRHRCRLGASRCHLGSTSFNVGNRHGNTVDQLRQLRRAAWLQDGPSVASVPQLRASPIVGSLTLDVVRRGVLPRSNEITSPLSCADSINVISLRYQINNVVWEAS
jgi:hypothetical protein